MNNLGLVRFMENFHGQRLPTENKIFFLDFPYFGDIVNIIWTWEIFRGHFSKKNFILQIINIAHETRPSNFNCFTRNNQVKFALKLLLQVTLK